MSRLSVPSRIASELLENSHVNFGGEPQDCKLEYPIILVKNKNSFEACFGEEQVGRERSALGPKPVSEWSFAIAGSKSCFLSLGLI